MQFKLIHSKSHSPQVLLFKAITPSVSCFMVAMKWALMLIYNFKTLEHTLDEYHSEGVKTSNGVVQWDDQSTHSTLLLRRLKTNCPHGGIRILNGFANMIKLSTMITKIQALKIKSKAAKRKFCAMNLQKK